MDPRTTRGFLNNNPGNIDRSNQPWNGEIRDARDPRLGEFQRNELLNGRFCVFPAPEWGIRALALNLRAYQDRLGLRSIRAMISKWAPPNENNTEGYIQRVAATLKVSPDAPVDMREYKTAFQMCDAIIRVECGGMPYYGHEIEDGLRLAGVLPPVTVAASNTVRGSAAAVTGTGVSAAADQLQAAAATLEPAAQQSHWVLYLLLALKILGGIAVLVGIGLVLYERFGRHRRDEEIEQVPDHEIPMEPVPMGAGGA